MDDITRIAALAGRQHGAVSAGQLDEHGLRGRARQRAVTAGWLCRAGPNVFVLAGAPETVERALAIGLLQLGRGAVVSHEAAARLHGFDRCLPDAVEFTVLRGRRHAGAGLVVHSTRSLPPIDRVRAKGFPCTSATRTILDLARSRVTDVRLEAAIDSAVRLGLSSPIVIADRLGDRRGPGHWGTPQLDGLLVDAGGHSPLERRFLTLMRRHGLPRPSTQVVHRRGTRTSARVDFLFSDHGLVVEVSGRLGHVSDAERAKDAQRRNELQAAGRRVYEFTRAQVVHSPSAVAAAVAEALAVPRLALGPGLGHPAARPVRQGR